MDCYNYFSNKRKIRENLGLLLNRQGQRNCEKDMKQPEFLKVFFTSVLTDKIYLQESQATETSGKVWNKKELSLM